MSLLILGQEDVRKSILGRLESSDQRERWSMAMELRRVEDGVKLQFARGAIEQISKQSTTAWRNRQPVRDLLDRIPRD